MPLSFIPESFLFALAASLGLLFGSFLNVVIHRLPREQSVAFPPSTCPTCSSRIAPWDNIPVLSWLVLRGRARCCGERISARYPLVELLGGLLAVVVLQRLVLPEAEALSWYAGLGLFALYLALCLGLLAALFIDLEHMLLPDVLTLGGTALGLLSLPFREVSLADALVGGAVGYLIVWGVLHHGYRLLRGQPGMGLGDAKLLLLAGVWFGWPGALFALIAGSIQGTVVAIVVMLTQGRIEEPEAVKQERQALQKQLAELPPAERQALEQEFKGDILAEDPGEGFAGARLAFGPFLILSVFEYLFCQEWLILRIQEWLWPV